MEVTKHEIIFSSVIMCVMLAIGFLIAGRIDQNLQDKYIEYETAARIETHDQFLYGIKTGIGNAFVYGDLIAVDPVDGHGIEGQYAYVHRQKQEYRHHTRLVTVKRGKTTTTEVQHYYTWDNISYDDWHCSKISFLGVEFLYGTIDFPYATHIKTVYESSKVRYRYSVCYPRYTGTLYAVLKDNGISAADFTDGKNIDETLKSHDDSFLLILFWVAWIAATVGAVIGFVLLENRWLEDERT